MCSTPLRVPCPLARSPMFLISYRYERAARLGSARTRASTLSRDSSSKRAMTWGRSASRAARSNPVASP